MIYSLNESVYYRMPPIFHLDKYEPCLADDEGGLYCSVEMDLVSDEPSELLTMIHEYSEHKNIHYNHTNLHYGVCVTKTCKKFIKNSSSADLSTTLEACFNESFWNDYKLKVKVSRNISCHKLGDPLNIDMPDVVVALICLIILMLNIVGSFYDFFRSKENAGQGTKILKSFSILKNWKKLIAPSGEGSEPRLMQLKSINGFKTITSMLVILGHAPLIFMFDVDNPLYLEEIYRNILNNVLINGMVITQTFLIISGFLLTYKMQLIMEKEKVNWTTLPKGIILRWLRLIPSYALVLAVTATLARFVGLGPLWKTAVEDEVAACRENWWLHLLFINNYTDSSQCMAQTWYLAADMQLFCLSLALLVFVKGKRTRDMMLAILFLLGLIFPAVHTYYQDLDAIVIISPETTRNFFVKDPTFINVYIRGHTNLAGFVMGIALALYFYHCQNNKITLENSKNYSYLCWAAFLVAVVELMLCSVFYGDRPRASLFIRAIVAAHIKPIFAAFVLVLLLGCLLKVNSIIRYVLEWDGWTTLSRVSYSAYLIHVFFIRTFAGIQTTLMHASTFHIFVMYLGIVSLSFLAAFPFWLLVEAPFDNVVRVLTTPDKPNNEKKTVNVEEKTLGDKKIVKY